MSQYTMGPRSRDSGAARLWLGWTVALLAILLAAGGRQAAHSVPHGVIETIPWELFGLAIALTALIAVALVDKHGSTLPLASAHFGVSWRFMAHRKNARSWCLNPSVSSSARVM